MRQANWLRRCWHLHAVNRRRLCSDKGSVEAVAGVGAGHGWRLSDPQTDHRRAGGTHTAASVTPPSAPAWRWGRIKPVPITHRPANEKEEPNLGSSRQRGRLREGFYWVSHQSSSGGQISAPTTAATANAVSVNQTTNYRRSPRRPRST